MNNAKDEIQKTLDSLDSIERATMSPLAADRIWQKAMANDTKDLAGTRGFSIPIAWISGLAALVILNIAFLTWMNQEKTDDYDNTTTLSSLYFDTELDY